MDLIASEIISRIKLPQHLIKLKVSGIECEIRPYTHGDSLPFLEIMEDFRNKNSKGGVSIIKRFFQAQENLIDSCVVGGKVKSRNLHNSDFVQLMLEIKAITKGEKSIIKFRCGNERCEGYNGAPFLQSFEFDTNDLVLEGQIKEEAEQRIEISNDDSKMFFIVRPYTFSIMKENSDIFDEDKITNKKTINNYYSSFIKAIEFEDGKVYENMPKETISAVIDSLTDYQIKPLLDYIKSEPFYTWEKKWECPHCQTKNVAQLQKVTDFFF